MSLNPKFRACIITAMLLISSLSFIVISSRTAKADIGDDLSEEEQLILSGTHPFVTTGFFEYSGDEPLQINGNIEFNLYFTSTLASQSIYKDDLNVTLYSSDLSFSHLDKIGNTTITLKPDLFGDTVQNCTVTLEKVSYTLNPSDYLIFTVEIKQSGKPIGNIIEKRYETKLKDRALKIGELLNKTSNEDLKNIGSLITDTLGTADELGITTEEIGSLASSFSSSSFVYNSADYPSSVTLPVNTSENLTLYFNASSTDEGLITEMTEEGPNDTAVTWPARLFDIDSSDLNTDAWLNWFTLWLNYIATGAPPGQQEENNIFKYYLKGDNTLVLNEPTGNSPSKIKISSPTKWEDISFDRNRIIKNVTGEFYVYYPKIMFLRKITVNATLFDETAKETIASQEKQLARTTILERLLRRPNHQTVFTFDDAVGKEIPNGHKISLSLVASGEPKLSFLKSTTLFCDSISYTSSITFNMDETKNIQINLESKKDQQIVAGGSAEYVLNISSKYAEDNANLEVNATGQSGDWYIPESQSLELSEGYNLVHVFINSTDNSTAAYGDNFTGIIEVAGKTGLVKQDISVEVSQDAVEYNVNIEAPSGKEIKHGASGTYTFKIVNDNTGFWPDSYTINVSSEHNWADWNYTKKVLNVGEDLEVNVTVFVPEDTDVSYDMLTLSVKSDSDQSGKIVYINVTTTVISPNILENIYSFFESTAKSIGLDSALGDYAAAFLIFMVVFIILIFLIIIIYLIRIKYVDMICLERVKDVDPDEKAEFNISVHNPRKQRFTYELKAETQAPSDRWDISLDTESISLEPNESKPLMLTVKPTDFVKSGDWVEVKILAKAIEKQKTASISTVTALKDVKPELEIMGVFHWPRNFKKGDLVKTSFRIENKGKVSANNVSVVLFINGEEKNKVEDITIPRGGYAEIEIPWVAVKGKNEINIIVR